MLQARRFNSKRLLFAAFLISLPVACVWAVSAALYAPMPTQENPVYFYSNHTRDDLAHIYKKALKSAKNSIQLSIYALTDPHLIELLEERAEAGIKVTLYYDSKATKLPSSLKKKCTHFPYKNGALMHRKILIIDEKNTFLGSANLTPTSLKIHDNLVIGIHNAPFAKTALRAPQTPLVLPAQTGQLWLLPEGNPDALHSLIHHINTAKNKIDVALFTLTHPQLVEALINAHHRGVHVTCILDHYTAKGASKKAQETLQRSGVTVCYSRGQQLFHHKWVYIDNHTLFFGSANWTQAAFSTNSDCLMRLSPLTQSQRKFMQKMWKIIRLESKPAEAPYALFPLPLSPAAHGPLGKPARLSCSAQRFPSQAAT